MKTAYHPFDGASVRRKVTSALPLAARAAASMGLLVWVTCGGPVMAQVEHASPVVQAPTGSTSCMFNAWTPFRAEAPVPVRNAPSASSAIVGHLAVVTDDQDDERGAIEFDVVETQPGWLKIEKAVDPSQSEDDAAAPREVYRGAGWISNDMAQVGIQSSLGYAEPDAESALVLDLGSDWLTDNGRIDAVQGCSGEWILLDYTLIAYQTEGGGRAEYAMDERKSGTAWFRGVCSNQYTTCDMASVDRR